MPLRTKQFMLFPWIGGVNTALDPSTVPATQLIEGKNVVFGVRGSRKKRDGINQDFDDQANDTDDLIGIHDFRYGSASRARAFVAVADDKAVYSYTSGGVRTTISGGTAWGSAITTACLTTINNLCIISVDGTGNIMKKWTGSGNIADLGGTPPVASISHLYRGRLWTNDKTNLDRVHYCSVQNPEEWNGAGDSGALDIGVGDGDPEGVTAIFSIKGALFIAKKTKLYRVLGETPETYVIEIVSSGIGCVSHNAVAYVDQDDVIYMSERGVHSLAATSNYGDFEAQYLSSDIQGTFNDKWVKSRLKYAWGAYLSPLNSVAFAVTDSDDSAVENKTIWLYNIPLKSWYVWPGISCCSLITANDADKKRFYIGNNVTRLVKTFQGTNYDINTSGGNAALTMRIKTPIIYVDENPYTTKGFKKFSLLYRPVGTHTVTVSVKIDNYETQTLSFSQLSSLDLLGSTFILGQSLLGSSNVMAPYTQQIDGYGRGIQITMEQSGTDEEIEIQGFILEYETAGTAQEIVQTT